MSIYRVGKIFFNNGLDTIISYQDLESVMMSNKYHIRLLFDKPGKRLARITQVLARLKVFFDHISITASLCGRLLFIA